MHTKSHPISTLTDESNFARFSKSILFHDSDLSIYRENKDEVLQTSDNSTKFKLVTKN